jgi:hypothetical protein
MHYLLFYDVVPDYLERRAKFRKEHLDLGNKGVKSRSMINP